MTDYIRAMQRLGWTAKQIYDQLSANADYGNDLPTLRTIQRFVGSLAVPVGDTWTFAGDEDTEARAVLDVLGYLIRASEGRRTELTQLEAKWVKKVSRVARDIDPGMLLALAWEYGSRDVEQRETYDLDQLLAFEPWRETEFGKLLAQPDDEPTEVWPGRTAYDDAVRRGWITGTYSGLLRSQARASKAAPRSKRRGRSGAPAAPAGGARVRR